MKKTIKKIIPNTILILIFLLTVTYVLLDCVPKPVRATVTSVTDYASNDGYYSIVKLNTEDEPNIFKIDNSIDKRPWSSSYIKVNFSYMDWIKSHWFDDYVPIHNTWEEIPETE